MNRLRAKVRKAVHRQEEPPEVGDNAKPQGKEPSAPSRVGAEEAGKGKGKGTTEDKPQPSSEMPGKQKIEGRFQDGMTFYIEGTADYIQYLSPWVAIEVNNIHLRHKENRKEVAFGADGPLLETSVHPLGSAQDASTIYWSGPESYLWSGEPHHRPDIFPGEGETGDDALGSFETRFREILRPWEQWSKDLQCAEPAEGDKWSQTKGIYFPYLDLSPTLYQFRLFILMPSFGDPQSPIRGHLILTHMYLHSCYTSVRHSRGNPSFRGEIIVDDRPADVTGNLELFLRHIRHPTKYQALFIRELCINRDDPNERRTIYKGEFHARVEDCSCGIVDMSQAMSQLDAAGYVREPPRTTEKEWNTAINKSYRTPWHKPSILKFYPAVDVKDIDKSTQAQMANLPPYRYVPLDIAAREIRLLQVNATHTPDSAVIVDVCHVPLRSEFHYHALSYSWGSSELTHYVRDADSKIAVTENLYNAILRFRAQIDPDGGGALLWADAVCIDQSSAIEKALCIPRMDRIYEAAVASIISIAPPNYITAAARKLLKELGGGGKWAEQPITEKSLNQVASLDAWADVYSLLRLEYFGRRWIVQELACASETLIMMGPPKEQRALRTFSRAAMLLDLSFDDVLHLWIKAKHPVLRKHPELLEAADKKKKDSALARIKQSFEQVKALDFTRSLLMNNKPPTFLFLAVLTQSTKCSDPRDIIYSLWNISQEHSLQPVHFKYDYGVRDCYINFTKMYMSLTGSLDLACVSQLPMLAQGDAKANHPNFPADVHLPSWCPDYRQDQAMSSLVRRAFLQRWIHKNKSMPELDSPPYHADKLEHGDTFSAPVFEFREDQLAAHGMIIDTVEFISAAPLQVAAVSGALVTVYDKWLYEVHVPMYAEHGTGGEQDDGRSYEKFTQALNDKGPEGRNATLTSLLSMASGEPSGEVQSFWDHKVVENRWQWISSYTDKSPLQEYLTFDERSAHMIKGRRLILTAKGYMGLAPWHVRKGFKLAVLQGCSVPVLLEHVDSTVYSSLNASQPDTQVKTGWYFRGDCFVQGWMEGEMIRSYGNTTEQAWAKLDGTEHDLLIN